MNILVTGGTGYIGSHTCVALLLAGYSIVIVDNLCNSKKDVVNKILQITGEKVVFYEYNITDSFCVDEIFKNNKIDGVMHFASLKSVGESITKPLEYYYNNILGTVILLEKCMQYGVERFVFSSSATVYGENVVPFVETADLLPTTNPYGETKIICERIITDVSKTCPSFAASILRYFNPVGAHESGLIGELPNGVPNNLMPYITQVAKGIQKN